MKVNIKYSAVVVLSIFINLCYISPLDSSIYFIIRNFSIPLSTLYVFCNYKIIPRRLLKINLLVCLLCIQVFASSWLSGNLTIQAITYQMNIFFLFIVLEIVAVRREFKDVIKVSSFYLFFLLLINDVFMLLYPPTKTIDALYFVGNKFSVAYYHMALMTFWLALYRGKYYNVIVMILCFIVVLVTKYVDCNTAFVITIIFGVVSIFGKSIYIKLISPLFPLVTTLVSSFILILYSDFILNLSFVKYLIVDVLNRSLTLTGRLSIFESILPVINGRLLWGYGYGNSIMNTMYNYANTQNALLQVTVNYGVIGATLLVAVIFYAFRNQKLTRITLPFILIIYVFIISGCVEITFGTTFFILLAFLNASKLSDI